jgi:predicted Rossmann fold flavoprotein
VSADSKIYDLIVIGGGAAGFFGAIQTAEQKPELRILILEKTTKLLSKVKVSGGGRCNVTHHCLEPTALSQHYPRGQKALKKLFRKFNPKDTIDWFARMGVELKKEDDGRMFPITDSSQTIIDCFLHQCEQFNIEIQTSCGIDRVTREDDLFVLHSNLQSFRARKVLVASGGHNQPSAYDWLRELSLPVVPTIPSLFTFNDHGKQFKDLMGVAVPSATVKIAGSKFSSEGPVLITHWGLSGPAVIRLSAWAAEYLHQLAYEFVALINWTGTKGEEDVRKDLADQRDNQAKRKIINHPLFGLPQRLWERLLLLAEIGDNQLWGEASNKDINKLIEFLIRCPFNIKGKTTFKEEFVSCGGVDLEAIDLETMSAKNIPGLYFAGEVLNIDGETGGFNFQSAWTTGFVAAMGILNSKF